MKKMFIIMTCAIIAGLGMQSCKPNDSKVQSEVEKTLQTNYSSVSTSVKEGTVTLSGTVNSQDEKMAAERAAKSVSNVKSVVNNITVREPMRQAPAPAVNADSTISSTITTKLHDAGYKDVKVAVNNGEVTLTGDLKRADLTKVMQIANESNPRKVTNNLNLK